MHIKAETSVGLFIIIAIVIFLYMTFQIGVFRFDNSRYNDYIVYFYDVSGLSKKCDVQIAGVKVGWVESIELVNNGQQVRALVRILKDYTLYNDSYGLIRQDGLLGTKYLEIIPGNPLLPAIKPGGILMKPSKEPVSVDAILSEFQDIARNLQDVTRSFKNVIGGDLGSQRLENLIEGFTQAADSFATASRSVDLLIGQNQNKLDDMINDLRQFSHDLKNEFPQLSADIRSAIERFATQFDKAAQPIGEVAEKINKGEGVLGKLIADEDIANDAKKAIQGLKDYFETVDRLAVIFDGHVESMYGDGNKMWFRDGKGYFNVRVHPTEDYFYLLGFMGSFSGRIEREEVFKHWEKCDGQPFNPQEMILDDWAKLYFAPVTYIEKRIFDQYLLNLQLGKIYNDVAFRLGLFEGTFGVAVDYELPFDSKDFRWVSTLEAFDFYGRNRICDHRLHLKWLNKLFFSETLYMVFGADDFISHTNRNGFFGAGLRFADDDVKYIFSRAR